MDGCQATTLFSINDTVTKCRTRVSREFHSSKLHYLDRPEDIVSEWEEGREGCRRHAEGITSQLAAGVDITRFHYTWRFYILLC